MAMSLKNAIRRIVWRWLKPEAQALITDRLLDFYDGLRESEQIPPSAAIMKPIVPSRAPTGACEP